jgi:hypothetical protein
VKLLLSHIPFPSIPNRYNNGDIDRSRGRQEGVCQ